MANGGDLIEFSRSLKIRYSDLAAWITGNEGNFKIYSKAIEASEEFIRKRVLNELSHMAFFDLREAYNDDGTLKKPKDWPDSVARALAGVEVEELFEGTGKERECVGDTSKIKLHDKIKALTLIGQEHGMFIQKVKHEGTLKLEELVGGSFDEPETKTT